MGSTEERREKAKAFVRYSCCQGGGGEKGFWNMSRGKIYDMGLLAYVGKSYVGVAGGGCLKVKPYVVKNEFQNSLMYCVHTHPSAAQNRTFARPRMGQVHP